MPHTHVDPVQPSDWVRRWAELVTRGPVLDIASGGGRHSLLFAERGFEVVAVDRDAQAIPGVRAVQADLESAPWPFAGQRFAAIVVTNYLHRPLFPTLAGALDEEGVLEIRPVFEAEDFGAEFTPELRAQEERIRAGIEQQAKKA